MECSPIDRTQDNNVVDRFRRMEDHYDSMAKVIPTWDSQDCYTTKCCQLVQRIHALFECDWVAAANALTMSCRQCSLQGFYPPPMTEAVDMMCLYDFCDRPLVRLPFESLSDVAPSDTEAEDADDKMESRKRGRDDA